MQRESDTDGVNVRNAFDWSNWYPKGLLEDPNFATSDVIIGFSGNNQFVGRSLYSSFQLIDLQTMTETWEFGLNTNISSFHINQDATKVVFCTEDGQVLFSSIGMSEPEWIHIIEPEEAREGRYPDIGTCKISPNEERVVVGMQDDSWPNGIRVIDTWNGSKLWSDPSSNDVSDFKISHDSQYIVASQSGMRLWVYGMETGLLWGSDGGNESGRHLWFGQEHRIQCQLT